MYLNCLIALCNVSDRLNILAMHLFQISIGINRVFIPYRRLRKSLCSSPVYKLVDDLVR